MKHEDMVVHQVSPLNAESPRGALTSAFTALDAFYVRSHGPVPNGDPAAWTVTVDGLVDRSLVLSLDDLRARFAEREVVATLQCAGNRRAQLIAVRDIPGEAPWGPGATGTARWRGVALADVLAAAGMRDEAAHVAFLGAELCAEAQPVQPFGGSIPRRKAMAGEALLAWSMNDEPLPPIHGGPLRMLVPGYIGARSVKWIERITAQEAPSDNWFQSHAYRLLTPDVDPKRAPAGAGLSHGPVADNAEIVSPGDGATVAAGDVEVLGYAFAGDNRRIVRVDVSSDGGRTWRQAELLEDLGPWAWRHWRARVEVAAGPAEIVARAWDSAAATQPEHPRDLWNPKGYANNSWARVRLAVAG
jgi:sulfite oxidase